MPFPIVGSPGWTRFDQELYEQLAGHAVAGAVEQTLKGSCPDYRMSEDSPEIRTIRACCAPLYFNPSSQLDDAIMSMLTGLEPGPWMDAVRNAFLSAPISERDRAFIEGAYAFAVAFITHDYLQRRRADEDRLVFAAAENLRVLVTGGGKSEPARFLSELHETRGPIGCLILAGNQKFNFACACWADGAKIATEEYRVLWHDVSDPDAVVRTGRAGVRYDARAAFRRNGTVIRHTRPQLVAVFGGAAGIDDLIARARQGGAEIVFCEAGAERERKKAG
mgnify:CR=1 FL=1